MNLALTLFFLIIASFYDDGVIGSIWENPLDGFFSRKSKNIENSIIIVEDPTNEDIDNKEIYASSSCNEFSACQTYLKRFISIILHNSGLETFYMNRQESFKTVTVDISVSRKALHDLQRFIKNDPVTLQELDEALVSFFKAKNSDTGNEMNDDIYSSNENMHEYLNLLSPTYILLGFCICFSFILYKKAILRELSIRKLILVAFFLYFCCGVAFNLLDQYEDLRAKQILEIERSLASHGKMPDECFPSKMSFWKEAFLFITADETCDNYLKTKKSTYSELDLMKAFNKNFHGLVFQIIPSLGDATGGFVNNFSAHFSGPVKVAVVTALIYILPSLISTFFSTYIGGFSRLNSLLGRNVHQGQAGQNNELPAQSNISPLYNLTSPPTINYFIGNPSLEQGREMSSSSLLSRPRFRTNTNKVLKRLKHERRVRKEIN